MSKPRSYKLEQCPTSEGYMQASLHLSCFEDSGRFIFVHTYHDIELKPRSARAMAKRLIAMADWAESEVK